MAASIMSPVLIMSSSGVLCAITMRAPVLSSDILRQASVRSFTASLPFMAPFFLPRTLSIMALLFALFMYLFPRFIRNFLISGWNMTISARTPTSRTVSISAVISLMLNADTRTRIRYSDTMATKMLIADEPLSHLKARNMIRPSSRMSRMSANDICRKPNNASNMCTFLYICANIRNFII